jgi:DNA-binding CsgD family transcriptional regulator
VARATAPRRFGDAESIRVGEQVPFVGDDPLSTREREVTRLLVIGFRNVEVATRLGISIFTVGKHVENIYRKLGVHSRHELAGYALRLGIV